MLAGYTKEPCTLHYSDMCVHLLFELMIIIIILSINEKSGVFYSEAKSKGKRPSKKHNKAETHINFFSIIILLNETSMRACIQSARLFTRNYEHNES